MNDFVEHPELCTVKGFRQLLKNEAERRGFDFFDKQQNSSTWIGSMKAPDCTLVFTVQVAEKGTRLSVESKDATRSIFEVPPVEFLNNGQFWLCWFEQFRMDWLAWLFSEFAIKGETIIFNSKSLADEYLKANRQVGLNEYSWLDFYQREFDTAEINNSFYRLPSEPTYADWADHVNDDFLLAVKGSRC